MQIVKGIQAYRDNLTFNLRYVPLLRTAKCKWDGLTHEEESFLFGNLSKQMLFGSSLWRFGRPRPVRCVKWGHH